MQNSSQNKVHFPILLGLFRKDRILVQRTLCHFPRRWSNHRYSGIFRVTRNSFELLKNQIEETNGTDEIRG
jgi:hypothetical protein